jgi:hypothetical protein
MRVKGPMPVESRFSISEAKNKTGVPKDAGSERLPAAAVSPFPPGSVSAEQPAEKRRFLFGRLDERKPDSADRQPL